MSTFRSPAFARNALAVALCSALALGTTALAQDQEQTDTPPDAEEGQALALDAITVTARKREESVMAVPMNISVLSAVELEDRNISNVQELHRTIAGGASPVGELILRGLVGGNTASPGTTSQFVDGVPFDFGNVFDIAQVEILRGPQGTLWGSNAIGGTIQIRTQEPVFNYFDVFTTLVGEREKNVDGTRSRMQAGVNIPLIDDTLALRVTASVSDTPGKIVNAHTGNAQGSKNEFVRSQLKWQPVEAMNITLGHVWMATDGKGTRNADRSIAGYYWVPSLTENPDSPWGYDVDFNTVPCPAGAERPACRMPGSPLIDSDPRYTIYDLLDRWSRDTTNLFSLRADYDNLADVASVHYVGSFRKNASSSLDDWSRLDMEDMGRTWIVNRSSDQRVTHELRIQSLERRAGFDWTFGLFQDRGWEGYNPDTQWQYHDTDPRSIAVFSAWNDYFEYGFTDLGIHTIAELGQALYGDPGINYNLTNLHTRASEEALFGEVSYLLDTGVGQFEFTGGLRRFQFEDATAFRRSGIWFGTDGDNPFFDEAYSGEESGSRRKFSVSWQPNEDLNVYGLYSEGYRPGGNNAPLPASCMGDDFVGAYQARYNSDQIDNYELGFKANLLGRRAHISSAIYRIDWSETWAEVYMPSCGFSYITNTPGESARSQGMELESSFRLTDSTTLMFNYGYTDSELTVANPALGAQAGTRMTMVPRYNAYLAVDQGFTLFGRQAFARIDLAAYGEYKSHFNTRDADVAPPYRTVNLSGRINLNDYTTLSVYLNNVLNEEYLTYRSARSRTSSRAALTERYGDERNIAVRLDYRF